MPRYAHYANLLHYHDYIPPHQNPLDKMYAHHRRHTYHTYATKEGNEPNGEIPEAHQDGDVEVNDDNYGK